MPLDSLLFVQAGFGRSAARPKRGSDRAPHGAGSSGGGCGHNDARHCLRRAGFTVLVNVHSVCFCFCVWVGASQRQRESNLEVLVLVEGIDP